MIVEYIGKILNYPTDEQGRPAVPQIALFFAGKHRKVSGCLLSNYESEFHRTRCAWIFNDGLEKTKNVVNSERCRNQSKQIGIISVSDFESHIDKNMNVNSPGVVIAEDGLEREEILRYKCDIFLCVDDTNEVQKFRTFLASYLAEERGIVMV